MSIYPVYHAIRSRRSIRAFRARQIKRCTIRKILDAGRWAPSGLNNQPWRFVVVRNTEVKERIARCTKYSSTIRRSDFVVLIFLDRNNSYHLLKDAQAIGACIQSMLLCAFEMGIASCWMGEIIHQKGRVNALLDLKTRYDLMAAVAFGYAQRKSKSQRASLDRLLIKEYR